MPMSSDQKMFEHLSAGDFAGAARDSAAIIPVLILKPSRGQADVGAGGVHGTSCGETHASGYGGVLVSAALMTATNHRCLRSYAFGEHVSAIGDSITAGDTIGVLGTGDSAETDGERKHLHLSIHKGTGIDIRGYVASQSLLDQWLDPCQLLNLAGACSL
jgi:hypothetical protein